MPYDILREKAKEIEERTRMQLAYLKDLRSRRGPFKSMLKNLLFLWSDTEWFRLCNKITDASRLSSKYLLEPEPDNKLRIDNCNERGVLQSDPVYQTLTAVLELPERQLKDYWNEYLELFRDSWIKEYEGTRMRWYNSDESVQPWVKNFQNYLRELKGRMENRTMTKNEYSYVRGHFFGKSPLSRTITTKPELVLV